MRVYTGRTPTAHLGQSDADVFSLEMLPNLRRRYVVRKNGRQELPKYAKIGPLVQNSPDYIFLKDTSGKPISGHHLTLIDWTNAMGVDPVTYVAPRIVVSEYDLVPKAQENAFLAKLPMPNIPTAKMMVGFWEATANAFQKAQEAYAKGQDRTTFSQSPLVLKQAIAYEDKATVEFGIVSDIEVWSEAEYKTISSGIRLPLRNAIEQAKQAIDKGEPGFFSSIFSTVESWFLGANLDFKKINDEKVTKFVRFYNSLTAFEKQAAASMEKIRALGVSPVMVQALDQMAAQVAQIQIVRRNIESQAAAAGIPVEKFREAAAGLGAWPVWLVGKTAMHVWGIVLAAVVFGIVGDLMRSLGVSALIGSLFGIKSIQVKELKEQMRIQQEAATQFEKEEAQKTQRKIEQQMTEIDKTGNRLYDTKKYLEEATGEAIPEVKRKELHIRKVAVPSDIVAPDATPYILAGLAGVAALGIYYYATRENKA